MQGSQLRLCRNRLSKMFRHFSLQLAMPQHVCVHIRHINAHGSIENTAAPAALRLAFKLVWKKRVSRLVVLLHLVDRSAAAARILLLEPKGETYTRSVFQGVLYIGR